MTPVSEALVSEERLREIIAGCDGVTLGPWERTEVPPGHTPGVTYVSAPQVAKMLSISWNRHPAGNAHRDAAHIARLDPATVRAICTELLSRRSAPALSQDEGAGVGVIAAIEAERLRHFCSGADCEPFDHGRDEGFDLAKKAAIAALSMRKPSEAEVEAAARAMCIDGGFDPDERMPNDGPRWRYYASGARAALQAAQEVGK